MNKHSTRARPVVVSVGQAVRARRQQLGVSQDYVAFVVGCKGTNVYAIEHGKNEMKIGTLDAIARALECSSSDLLRDAEQIRARLIAVST
ncbi:MAG TPA: helix-turn-helix transcriptional regulator [Polyangiaceae bacterium]|nr:helix-turn-helix transcriptional regulator [Polyangiaceae bacterium]